MTDDDGNEDVDDGMGRGNGNGNGVGGGRIEDLYFMKKAHRRVLMKKIGIMRLATLGGLSASSKSRRIGMMGRDEVEGGGTAPAADVVDANDHVEGVAVAPSSSSSSSSPPISGSSMEEDDGNDGATDDFVLDDLAARYSSLDVHSMDGGTRDKELRRLRELREILASSKYRATTGAERDLDEYDFVLDDLSARYSSLDVDAMDGGSRDKELRRLRDLRAAFQKRKERDRSYYRYADDASDFTDDFSSKWYDPAKGNAVMTNVVGVDNKSYKGLRRLGEIKKRALDARASIGSEDEEKEEPLRIDLLKKRTGREANEIERKERMRLMELQRLVAARLLAEKRAAQDRRDDDSGSGGVSSRTRNTYKTNEQRRLEDLERYLINRRSNWQSLTFPPRPKPKDGEDDSKIDDALMNLDDDAKLDTTANNIQNREAYRSLSTTMPPSNRGVKFVRNKNDDSPAELCDLEEDEECWDITRNPNFNPREAQSFATRSLSTTMPPTNRGVRFVRDKNDNVSVELCDLEKDEECWDITRNPNFNAREAQSFATRSLSTTMPPTNRDVRFVRDTNDGDSAELTGIAGMYENLSRVNEVGDNLTNNKNDIRGGEKSGVNSFPYMENMPLDEVKNLSLSLTEGGREGRTSSITSNEHYPQKQKRKEYAEDQSAGHAREVDETAKTKSTEVPSPVFLMPSPSSDKKNITSKTQARSVSAMYQRLQSKEQIFSARSEKSQNHPIYSTPPTLSGGSLRHDMRSRFPEARPSMSVKYEKRKDDEMYYHVISRFPKERPSSLVNTGTKKEWTTSGSYHDNRYLSGDIKGNGQPVARNDATDRSLVSTPLEAASWPAQQFLDKPRPFQSNVDMITSNTSGIRFKKSSDLRHEEKNGNFDRWTDMPDIDALRGWRQSKLASAPELVIDLPRRSKVDERDHYSGEEKVMHWLLTHLPNIQEEDAVNYFNCLIEDGFDSVDLDEILESDLYFMKKGHRRALLQNLIKELYSEVYESLP
ncbi:hypothetical protein ACHAXA_002285 [Cyclostephanos tholiformis]|uniref:SAM domain-containing protein n=1 Tax=Cyclostephanos tholiformis TaxID=382380 RepID=A0ABD3RDD6_9STRA